MIPAILHHHHYHHPLLLLLILLFLRFSHACRTAPAPECQKPPFVPGHNLVGEGFDIVKLKTTGAFVVDVKPYLVGGEDGNCTLCQNTLLGQEQKLPAIVRDWRVRVRCRRSLSARIYETASSVLEEDNKSFSAGAKVGLGLAGKGAVYLGGTHSRASEFAISHSTRDRYSFTSHQVSCRYYTFRLQSKPPMTHEFKSSLIALPYAYSKLTAPDFRHFLATYGTHYLRSVDLGGRVKSTTAVRTCEATMNSLSVHDVSNCLSVEAAAKKNDASANAQLQFCHAKSKKLNHGRSFSSTFSDRVTDVLGGSGESGDILFAPDKKGGYDTWFKSLKTLPGVVSFQLTPLHMLVNSEVDPQRHVNLRNAIRDYIMQSAVSKACGGKCGAGRRDRSCSCKCSSNKRLDSNCCPSKPGLASLSVVVERATGLWGDYFSKTDGYVKVSYSGQGSSTPVIWNNNFPVWNFKIPFGTVDLLSRDSIKFEVWDRDNRWDDDLLGKVTLRPSQGVNVRRSFKLKHGTLYVSYSTVCAPSLAGPFCGSYSPSPGADAPLAPLTQDWHYPHHPSLIQRSDGGSRNNTFL